jgi:hypothetical protein
VEHILPGRCRRKDPTLLSYLLTLPKPSLHPLATTKEKIILKISVLMMQKYMVADTAICSLAKKVRKIT